jgi:hypothetical protein
MPGIDALPAMTRQEAGRKGLLAIVLLIAAALPALARAESQLDIWLSKNEPRVISYLQTLDAAKIGSKLPGAALTDGNMELEGYTYAGHVRQAQKGAHIYLFRYDGADVAYIWVDAGGDPLSLPPCNADDPRTELPGWGGTLLSGDVYAGSAAKPGGRLLITHCVPVSWLKDAG